MISIIIPALNEAETVASVVRHVRASKLVYEVIVVDDGSTDGTPEQARKAGARVITSTLLGKGASMEDGMRAARCEVLLYLDGDLQGLRKDLVDGMAAPLLREEADLVKARFSRAAGRVTTLTARPLLRTFFPELARFEQPLSGIMAARKSLLEGLRFENDYGVDVGLLIDAAVTGARLAEVDIGHVEHDSQPLEVLGDMATQVARTILGRAARHGRLKLGHMREVLEVERQMQAALAMLPQGAVSADRLALFDMDGVLLRSRYIVELARRADRLDALTRFLDNPEMDPDERTRRIASVFAGVDAEVFKEAARGAELTQGANEAVVALRKAGYRVGIITDSYFLAADIVRRRVFADFAVAHIMRFRRGKATGQITLSGAMSHPGGCPEHACCKVNALYHLVDKMGIEPRQVVAVGDGLNDVCMLRAVGLGIAFEPKSPVVAQAADRVVEGDLTRILPLIRSRRCPA